MFKLTIYILCQYCLQPATFYVIGKYLIQTQVLNIGKMLLKWYRTGFIDDH